MISPKSKIYYSNSLPVVSASDWLKGPPRKRKKRFFKDLHPWQFFLDNVTLIVYLTIYFSINIVLFIEAAHRHRAGGIYQIRKQKNDTGLRFYFLYFVNAGVLLAIARGGGQCLNFNPVVILILMMRLLITKIRGTFLSHILPLDHYIELHKLTGYVIVFFSLLHMFAHIINFSMFQ